MLMHAPASLAASCFDGGQWIRACSIHSTRRARVESSLQYVPYPYQTKNFIYARQQITEFMPSVHPFLERFIYYETVVNNAVIK